MSQTRLRNSAGVKIIVTASSFVEVLSPEAKITSYLDVDFNMYIQLEILLCICSYWSNSAPLGISGYEYIYAQQLDPKMHSRENVPHIESRSWIVIHSNVFPYTYTFLCLFFSPNAQCYPRCVWLKPNSNDKIADLLVGNISDGCQSECCYHVKGFNFSAQFWGGLAALWLHYPTLQS